MAFGCFDFLISLMHASAFLFRETKKTQFRVFKFETFLIFLLEHVDGFGVFYFGFLSLN